MSSLIFRFLPYALGLMCVAAITHVSSILLMPATAPRNAALRLIGAYPVNQLELMTSGQADSPPLPFSDPALITAVCAFDVTDGPVRLRLRTGDAFLSLIILRPDGQVVHAMTDKAAIQRQIEAVVATSSQILAMETQDPEDEAVQELRLKVTDVTGVAVVRAMVPRAGESGDVRTLLQQADCSQD